MKLIHNKVISREDNTDYDISSDEWNADHVLDEDIVNSDIDDSAGIAESKLNLNYATHEHTNKAQIDLVTDGDHDVRTDNPHSVSKTTVGLSSVPNLDTTDAVANEHTHSEVETEASTDWSQSSPSASTWYNPTGHSISLTPGTWLISFSVYVRLAYMDPPYSSSVNATLSTANDSEIDEKYTAKSSFSDSGGVLSSFGETLSKTFFLTVASTTTYYLNVQGTGSNLDTLYVDASEANTIIAAFLT